ncbi:MAG: hypothetical protein IBJ18_09375 [Phycisphaerales bacterium]|nr:hypothetical protein [Phycisphaerales bacterium]
MLVFVASLAGLHASAQTAPVSTDTPGATAATSGASAAHTIDERLAPSKLTGVHLRGARAATSILRRMPAGMALAVVVPTGERLNEMMESLGRGVAGGENPAFHETQQHWRELGKHLGLTERQTSEALGGGASLVLISPHPADAPRAGSVRETDQLVWVSISEISEATERRLREKLDTVPRTLVSGRPVLTIESGALLMMVMPKGEAIGDPARPAWLLLTQSRPMGTLLSLSSPSVLNAPRPLPPNAGGNDQASIDANDAGERMLRAVAAALADTRRPLTPAANADVPNRDSPTLERMGDSPFFRGVRDEEMGWATVFVRFDDWRHAAQFSINPSPGANASDDAVTQLHVRAGSPELSRTLQRVPVSHDRVFETLRRDRGVLIIESAEPAAKLPTADPDTNAFSGFVGAVVSQSWREHLGAHAGAVSVLGARAVEDFTRPDGEPTWRVFLSQQLRSESTASTEEPVSPALLDRIPLKAMSIVETGRLRGGLRFGLSSQPTDSRTQAPNFENVPSEVQRISSAVPAPASWYLRLFTPRAWFAWRTDRLMSNGQTCVGVLNMTACGERPGSGDGAEATNASHAAGSKAQDDASAALEAWSSEVQSAFTPIGPSRRWISRGFVEPGFFRTALPMIFSPVLPTGPVLDHLAWVRWDVWADEAGELRGVVRVKARPADKPAPAKPE